MAIQGHLRSLILAPNQKCTYNLLVVLYVTPFIHMQPLYNLSRHLTPPIVVKPQEKPSQCKEEHTGACLKARCEQNLSSPHPATMFYLHSPSGATGLAQPYWLKITRPNLSYPSFIALAWMSPFEVLNLWKSFTDPETRVFQTAEGENLVILARTVFGWSTRVTDRRTELRWLSSLHRFDKAPTDCQTSGL